MISAGVCGLLIVWILSAKLAGYIRAGKPNRLPRRISYRLRRPTVPKQLEQVGGCAHQLPFGRHFVQSAQAEAAEASLLLDLAEDRFDDGLAPLVNGSPGLGAELVLHGLLGCG